MTIDSQFQQSNYVPVRLFKVAGLLFVALLVRLLFFSGITLGDDVFYVTQASALAFENRWPPEPLHWHTRLGIVVPTAILVKLFGPSPFVFVMWPLAISCAGLLVCFHVAESFTDSNTAYLAALFQACFPLEVIYSTQLFPDVLVGITSTLSIWNWIRGLQSNQTTQFLNSGVWFAFGYMCRETVIMEGPIYLGIWLWAGQWRRPKVLFAFVVPFVVLLLECGLYWISTGQPMYRWNAILNQQHDASNIALILDSTTPGGFWTDPFLKVLISPAFGIYHLLGLVIAVYCLIRRSPLTPLAIWLIVGFLWLYYGTTLPSSWVPLQRDPRYAASLTVPSVTMLAWAITRFQKPFRTIVVTLVVAIGLIAASLDQGNSVLFPHKQLLLQSQIVSESSFEPFEYFAIRWNRGLLNSTDATCAIDRGRRPVSKLMAVFPGTHLLKSNEKRYFVMSPTRRPELLKEMLSEGWVTVLEISGQPTAMRQIMAHCIQVIPMQRERATKVLSPPGLTVLLNPAFAVEASPVRTSQQNPAAR